MKKNIRQFKTLKKFNFETFKNFENFMPFLLRGQEWDIHVKKRESMRDCN